MRFIAPDLTQTATLSGGTTGYTAANLATVLRAETLRTSGVSAQTVTATWPANQTVSAVALCRHNLTSAATWRVQLYSDTGLTTQIYDSGFVTALISTDPGAFDAVDAASFAVLRNSVLWFAAQTTVRGLKVTLTDAANPVGYLEAARLFVGVYTDVRNPAWDYEIAWDDPTTQARTLGRSLLSQNNGDRTRSFPFQMAMMPVATRNFIFDMQRAYGMEKDFFMSMWPGEGGRIEREHQSWAKITAMQGMKRPMLNYYGTSITFGDC